MKIIPMLTIPKSSGVSILVSTVTARRVRMRTISCAAPINDTFLTVLVSKDDNGFGMTGVGMILSVAVDWRTTKPTNPDPVARAQTKRNSNLLSSNPTSPTLSIPARHSIENEQSMQTRERTTRH
jgi:hypothetical protein